MKLDSELFDSIRVKPERERTEPDAPCCQHAGCSQSGTHRAPKGRGREGEFFTFCIDHVREYNKSYNYFAGMSDEELAEYREAAATGHRPTWTMGANKWARGTAASPEQAAGWRRAQRMRADPHGFFEDGDSTSAHPSSRRSIGTIERKCLRALELDERATADVIKRRFKELVKRHHPDANGGDRASEDKLREVIQAYNYLKQAGLC
ncbi:MAG: DnaJ domain-containing protein [Rhizobiales bacterium]|nr:DnaJ domain-containing protein [Hyphomicrobiales bacterium]